MNTIRKLLAAITLVAFGSLVTPAQAAEVVVNGGLELGAGPDKWTLTQSITGEPLSPISAVEHLDQADIGFLPAPGVGGLGLLLKPQSGNEGIYKGQDKAVNVTLSQTVSVSAANAGNTFTFTGHSFFQLAASNNVTTLNVISPSGDYNQNFFVDAADYIKWRDTLGQEIALPNEDPGVTPGMVTQEDYDLWTTNFGQKGHGAIPSPTQTSFKVEFLDVNNAVIGTPTTFNLPKNRTSDINPDDWQTHTFTTPAAPSGIAKVRVTAAATDMVASCTTDCTAGQDVYFDDFKLIENRLFGTDVLSANNGNLNSLGSPAGFTIEKTAQDNLSFAGNPSFAAHSGQVGMWLRSFAGGDAKVLQTVPGVAGAGYELSVWAKLQEGYSGLDPSSATETFITMEFLNGTSVIGTPLTLDLRDITWDPGMGGQGVFQEISLNGTAPPNTTNVRISAGATGMVLTTVMLPQSAFFDDFSLIETPAGAGSLAAAVPEPTTAGGLILITLLGCAAIRRRPTTI